ncbi:hypothetical protein NDN08_005058 [Rhodosorus marinus]|uniref:RING-type domain-containing protein n=1 Tax=Rhodosorus marinus TaxID=101924 RepID=A0AAV8V3Y0_9RHOD|nr:hypothetical protein NDN08_005058 [Rhodosorus marinus]
MARRWKLFRFFVEEEVGGNSLDSEPNEDAKGLSTTRRLGLRLAQLLERDDSYRSSGGGWIAVVNRSAKEVELFDDGFYSHDSLKVHEHETHVVFLTAKGDLWAFGWDRSPGRDGLAQSSLRKVPVGKSDKQRSEDVIRLGRRGRATCISVRYGFAAIGFHGGDVAVLRVDKEGVASEAVRSMNVDAPSSGDLGVGRESEIHAVEMITGGAAVAVNRSGVYLIHYNSVKGELDMTSEELDSIGCEGPSQVAFFEGELAVVRGDAISFYSVEGRGKCLAMTSQKAYTASAGSHLFVLSTSETRGTELVGYDVGIQLISHRSEQHSPAVALFGLNETSIATVALNGTVQKLSLIPAEARLDQLLQRSLFPLAILLARREKKNNPKLRERAVSLYSKSLASRGEYDAAAELLISVISDTADISRVILLLKEQVGSRSALRNYLEALHSKGFATDKHMRLLVACYKDATAAAVPGGTVGTIPDSLPSLVEQMSPSIAEKIAIECRSAGMVDAAESIARSMNLDIVLAHVLAEDRKDVEGVLELMRDRSVETAEQIAVEVGRWLLEVEPENFVDVVFSIAIRGKDDGPAFVERLGDSVFHDAPVWHAKLLEVTIEQLVSSSFVEASEGQNAVVRLWERLFEVLMVVDSQNQVSSLAEVSLDLSTSPKGTELESMRQPEEYGLSSGFFRSDGRATQLLRSSRWKVDRKAAERMAQLFGHYACERILLEQAHDYEGLGRQLRLQGDRNVLLSACRRHGLRTPGIWLELLRLLSELPDEEVLGTQLEEVIESAVRAGAGSEVEIFDLLCKLRPEMPFSKVRRHYERLLKSLQGKAEDEIKAVTQLEKQLASMEAELEVLRKGPTVFQPRLCEVCDTQTKPPAVFFRCGHSCHERCLSAHTCPTCATTANKVSQVRNALIDSRSNHDAFFRQLELDGYQAIHNFLDRDILG